MRKFTAVLTVMCGLSAFATSARATSIGSCAQNAGTGQLTCDLSEDPLDGTGTVSSFTAGLDAGWLVGYSFLLDAPDPTVKANVSDVLIIHSDHIDLFSQGAGALFDNAYNAALAATAIDGNNISTGQVMGDILVSGTRQFNPGNGKIGLFFETTNPVVGLSFTPEGFFDIINIHSDADFNGRTAVPEPTTLSLMALGGVLAAYRRRRQSKNS